MHHETIAVPPACGKAGRWPGWLLVVSAGLILQFGNARAATECINPNAPDPLEICVDDDGTPSVYVQQPNGRQYQYYGERAWGSVIWLDGADIASRYGTMYLGYFGAQPMSAVSNTLTGTGVAADPYVITNVVDIGATGVRLTQTFRYVNGDRTLRKTFVLQNNGSVTFNDLRFFHGGDTYFGGDDSARSWYDATNNMVYVTNDGFDNSGLMGFYANPATPSAGYYSGNYYTGDLQAGEDAQLASTADSNYQDAGYFLQWNRATLLPSGVWTIDSFENWSAPGALQVIAPASDAVFPGTTVHRTFKVHNLTSGPLSITLNGSATPNGWLVSLPNGSSIDAAGLEVVEVPVEITVPAGATPGTFEDVQLTATSSSYTGSGDTRLSILQSDYILAPNALNFGDVSVGNAANLAVTLTNNAGAAPVTMGPMASVNGLSSPYSIVSDNCSNATIVGGHSCAVTVRFTPTLLTPSSDSFDFPILSPSITSQTIAVEGNNGAPASYTVSATAGAGGGISPGIATVNVGSTGTFAVTADSGHAIDTVSGCGGSLSGTVYTTGAILAACTVNATFAGISHTVTATAGANGSVSPGTAAVAAGAITSFTLTPDTGYSVGTVTGCGGSLTDTTYTTGAINGACSVSATFIVNTYDVTATSSAGGLIAPGDISVTHGNTTTFNLTASIGYTLTDVSGCGGSLSGAIYATGAITGDCAVTAVFAMARTLFQPAVPATYNLNATGLLTDLPADVAPGAVDSDGAPLAVTLVGGETRFSPGAHVLTWRAVDSRNVVSTVEQLLQVWPLVSTGKDVALGFVAGNWTSFRIALNGRSPVYPFVVNYTVGGHLQGHDLESGVAQFGIDEVEKDVYLAVTQTPPAGANDREVNVEISPLVNRGERHVLSIALLSGNGAATVMLSGEQNGQSPPFFTRSAGPVTLSAVIDDPDSSDTHMTVWTSPAGARVTSVSGILTLQADSLPPGVHRFDAVVTDSGLPGKATRASIDVLLADIAAVLPQGAPKWAPSGLPDHPDYSPVARNVLPERARELSLYLIEGDPGVHLSLGTQALRQGLSQAELANSTALSIAADTVQNIGGLFDFAIRELPQPGQSVSVVIPQRAAVPVYAVYRKFDAVARRWNSFVENPGNSLASARGLPGVCPPPSSGLYRPGLGVGDWCVRLTLSDGGPNDADREPNGVVVDPGGVATLATVVVTSRSKGGGGALGWSWLLLLGLLLREVVRLRAESTHRSRSRRATILLASLPFAGLATAAEADTWYAGVQVGPARSDIGEREVNNRLADLGYDVTASFSDLTRVAWRVSGGYQMTPFLGIQLSYSDLGTVEGRYSGQVTDIRALLADANANQPQSADGIDLSMIGRYPVTERWSVFGRLGLMRWNSVNRAEDIAGEFDRVNTRGVDPVFGAGVEFALFSSWSLDAEWTRFRIEREHIDLVGVGVIFRSR